jgi:hypothetical protein
MWEAGLPSGTLPDVVKNMLPPTSTIDDIKAYAQQCGLYLTAPPNGL